MLLKTETKLNVLVVDDSATNRSLAKMIFQYNPAVKKIDTACDYQDMMNQIRTKPDINCLILDFNLGKNSLNGIQSYTMLQSQGFDIPAILLTGEDVDAFESYTVGIVDVLNKGFLYDFKRIGAALQKINQYSFYKDVRNSGGLVVPVFNGKIKQFLASQVVFIESQSPGSLVHVVEEKAPRQSEYTLKIYDVFLKDTCFLKLSRYHIVNANHIRFYDDKDTITVTGGKCITISAESRNLVKMIMAKKEDRRDFFSISNWLLQDD